MSEHRFTIDKVLLTYSPSPRFSQSSLEFIEMWYCLTTLHNCEYNVSKALGILKVSRSAFYRRLRKWERLGFITRND